MYFTSIPLFFCSPTQVSVRLLPPTARCPTLQTVVNQRCTLFKKKKAFVYVCVFCVLNLFSIYSRINATALKSTVFSTFVNNKWDGEL